MDATVTVGRVRAEDASTAEQIVTCSGAGMQDGMEQKQDRGGMGACGRSRRPDRSNAGCGGRSCAFQLLPSCWLRKRRILKTPSVTERFDEKNPMILVNTKQPLSTQPFLESQKASSHSA